MKRLAPPRLVVTCEHAGAQVPDTFAGVVPRGLLSTHRAYDKGAMELAMALAGGTGGTRRVGTPLFVNIITRLLIDLNRSESNPAMWSRYGMGLSQAERDGLLRRVYRPFRAAVLKEIQRGLSVGPVIHLSVHSFTPVLRGERRTTDVGLLFDPARESEVRLCRAWQRSLRRLRPGWRVHFNRPYRGVEDGHTTALRGVLSRRYAGVELEVNQRLFATRALPRAELHGLLVQSLAEAMSEVGGAD